MATTRKISAGLRAYQAMQRAKKQFCAGKVNKGYVKAKAADYVAKATAKGNQTKAEAQAKADRVLQSGCSMTANIHGKKRKTTTTATRKRTTTATARRRATA